MLFRALRRDNDEGELLSFVNQSRRAVSFDAIQIAAAFACTMQKEQQRPAMFVLGVILRKIQQILASEGLGYVSGEALLKLITVGGTFH